MAKNAEHKSKFAALHRQWQRFQMSENSPWDEKLQTNKNTGTWIRQNKYIVMMNKKKVYQNCKFYDPWVWVFMLGHDHKSH